VTTADETTGSAIKDAIRDAYRACQNMPDGVNIEDETVDHIHKSVMKAVNDSIPAILDEAMGIPAVATAMITNLLIPTLRTLEDEINDEHDKPTTPDTHRAGLRAAARMIRNTRRAAEEETTTQ
jgi:hypothetical protein